jgi:hypothetical protein
MITHQHRMQESLMSSNSMTRQSGQAMSELIAAMAVLLPLILGVIYVGKYGDIKHQAVQASRYAALESALDPRGHEGATVIGNETVARFFRDGNTHAIGRDDQAQGPTAGDENPNWSQLSGDPMIAQYSDIKVNFSSAGSLSTPVDTTPLGAGQFGLRAGSGVKAEVQVPVAAVTHFAPLNQVFTLTASTVMAGDSWNGGGAADVASHIGIKAVPGKLLSYLKPLLEVVTAPLTNSGPPEFGCVKPDVVPKDAAPSATYNPLADPDTSDDPNKCR